MDICPIIEGFFEIVCYGEVFELFGLATLLVVGTNLKKLDLDLVI